MPDRLTVDLIFASLCAAMIGVEAWGKRTGRTRRDWTPFWIGGVIFCLAFALLSPHGFLRR